MVGDPHPGAPSGGIGLVADDLTFTSPSADETRTTGKNFDKPSTIKLVLSGAEHVCPVHGDNIFIPRKALISYMTNSVWYNETLLLELLRNLDIDPTHCFTYNVWGSKIVRTHMTLSSFEAILSHLPLSDSRKWKVLQDMFRAL